MVHRHKHLSHRLLAAFIGLLIGLTAAQFSNRTSKQELSQPTVIEIVGHSSTHDEEILAALLPNGNWGDESQLDRFPRREVVRVLKSAQDGAVGDRASAVAFLLAMFKDNYDENRTRLLDSLAQCRTLGYPDESSCAFNISSYLIVLARRGDTSLIKTLFGVHRLADGAFSEELGCFFSYELRAKPTQFLAAIDQYAVLEQQELCEAAAFEDGGGMADQDYATATRLLNSIVRKSNSGLKAAATNCRIGLNRARQMMLADRAQNK